MKLTINDTPIEVEKPLTISQLLTMRDIPTQGIAIAINNVVVPKSAYDSRQVADGDKIVIIKAFYGG